MYAPICEKIVKSVGWNSTKGWDELGATDQETAEEICSYCHHFEMEKRLMFSEDL